MQASPSDPENFPFVVLGNKIDLEGGRNRMVQFLPPLPSFLDIPSAVPLALTSHARIYVAVSLTIGGGRA